MASGTLVWIAALGSLGIFAAVARDRRRRSKGKGERAEVRRISGRPPEDREMIASLADPALRVLFADTRSLRRAIYADPALDDCRIDELWGWVQAVQRLAPRYPALSALPVEIALRATHRDEIERALAIDLGLRRVEHLILRCGRIQRAA